VNEPETAIFTLFVGVLIGALLAWLIFTGAKKASRRSVRNESLTPALASELLNTLSLIGMVLDPDDQVVGASTATALYGLIDGNKLSQPKLLELVGRARLSDTSVSEEVVLGAAKDDAVDMLARAGSFGSGFVLLQLEDHTEMRLIDEVRRDFVANVSHELKTPIGAIDLLTRSIRRHVDDPEKVSAYANDLAKQAERLANLVYDLIELSRIQASKSVGIEEPIDVTAAISDAIERNEVLAETKHVRVIADLSGSHMVYGDHEQLATALRNLIENAILYSDEGKSVGVGIKSDNNWCTISVKDEGAGIRPEDQKRIFERFYRVDQSRSRQTGGSGLGLSIVKHIADNHHGRVDLASVPGRGSTFSLVIPSAQNALQEVSE
jgi:two-component system sensor histidine kinase SenX3